MLFWGPSKTKQNKSTTNLVLIFDLEWILIYFVSTWKWIVNDRSLKVHTYSFNKALTYLSIDVNLVCKLSKAKSWFIRYFRGHARSNTMKLRFLEAKIFRVFVRNFPKLPNPSSRLKLGQSRIIKEATIWLWSPSADLKIFKNKLINSKPATFSSASFLPV